MSKPPSGACGINKPCPACGQTDLTLTWWLQAKPVGTFSLAGAQLKFSVLQNAAVQCDNCHVLIPGRISDDAKIEGDRFVSGGFESIGGMIIPGGSN